MEFVMIQNPKEPDIKNQAIIHPSPEDLRVEYQAAQDSAQHHDNISWTVTSIIWGGSLVLLGFTLDHLNEPSLRPVITVLCVLGISLNTFSWRIFYQFNYLKRQKYNRCKEIEKILYMKQHNSTEWPSGSLRILYHILVWMFVIAWLLVLLTTWTDSLVAGTQVIQIHLTNLDII
jgi:hypothetical protein